MSALPLFDELVPRTETDERYTPKWIFDALGETFDLDPASPMDAQTHVPAAKVFTRVDDGLSQPWEGFVWLNPPFSNTTPWADRFIAHAENDQGGALPRSVRERWTQSMLRAATGVWLMRDFAFDHPTHAGKRSSMPLAMYGFGGRALIAMNRATQLHPNAGTLVQAVLR